MEESHCCAESASLIAGESAEAISSRKLAAAWGSWLVLGAESEEVAPEKDVSAAENEEPEPRQTSEQQISDA